MRLFSWLIVLCIVAGTFSVAGAQDVTLQWDPNTEPDIAGYKIYYNADSDALPFTGSGAGEGVSPVDVGNATTANITGLAAGRTYYFAVTAYDVDGYESSFSNIVSTLDTVLPTVSIKSPAANATLSGNTTISVAAADNSQVAKVEIAIDGVVITTLTAAPYDYSCDTRSRANGSHTISATAYDPSGNIGTASVSVTFSNDLTPPAVAVTAPIAGASIAGNITVTATASDNAGVSSVAFLVDGALIGTVSTAPYSLAWNSASVANGSHTIAALAYDAVANSTRSQISVTVANDTTPPMVSISSPAAGTTVSGSSTVTATASDNVGVTKVEFYVGGVLQTSDAAAPFSFAWNTKAIQNGTYSLTAIAYDARNNMTTSSAVAVTVFNDTTAPPVSITAPTAGSKVGGTSTIIVTAADNVGVSKVEFYVDGVLKGTDTAAPHSFAWDTKTATNAAHSLTAKAYDAAGNVATSAAVSVNAFNDTTVPTVTVTAPAAGATLRGTATVTATATDDVGVTKVEFYVDGTLAGAATAAPYRFSWNTRTATNAGHTVTAKAYDAAGNVGTSAVVNVTVFNDTVAPTVSVISPAAAATVSGIVAVTASAADNVAVTKVEFFVDDVLKSSTTVAPYIYTWDSKAATNAVHSLAAAAYDATGNVAISSTVYVKVFNDVTAPSVSVTAPAAAATVSGTVSVTAAATDNVAVSKVEFYLDGILAGTSAAAPHSFSWNTKTATNAAHILSAKAFDAAGNTGTSAAVTITVFNDTTAPAVSITAPAAGASVSGTVSVAAGATDNVAVAKVEFYVNNTLKFSSATAPYSYSWDTRTVPNGTSVLVVKAYDAVGLVGVSAPVSVGVYNGYPSVSITSPTSGSKYYRRGGAARTALDVATMTVPVAVDAVSEPGIAQVELYVDDQLVGTLNSAPFVFSWDATNVNGMKKLHAKAYDVAGNIAESAAVDVLVGADITPPSIRFTAPHAGKGVTGIATVKVAAKDPGGIARVDLYIDGATVPYASDTTTKSFSFRWDTSTFAPGPHMLRAVAYDLIGNFAEATETVIVKDVVAPVVAIDPLPGSSPEAGVLNITATATDNVGVVNMKLYIDGKLKETATSGSISYAWDLTGVRIGRHTVTIVASDSAGKSSKQTVAWYR